MNQKSPPIQHTYLITGRATGLALGSVAAAAVTHASYHIVLYSICAISVASALYYIKMKVDEKKKLGKASSS